MPLAPRAQLSRGNVGAVWVGALAGLLFVAGAALAVDRWGLPGERRGKRRKAKEAGGDTWGPGGGRGAAQGGRHGGRRRAAQEPQARAPAFDPVGAAQRYLFGAEPGEEEEEEVVVEEEEGAGLPCGDVGAKGPGRRGGGGAGGVAGGGARKGPPPPKNFPAARLPVSEVQMTGLVGSPIHEDAMGRTMDAYRC